ncbi:MAG TPA: signal peptidase II, partial [Promineifilum sp.]|nr:signal peptidase II [Promineifilum sp.]
PGLENLFRITHTANTGAVFGLFQGTGMFFAGLAIIVAVAILYINYTLPGKQWLLRLALGLQLGGALGNMIDRFRQGHVTDFIDIGPWYIFNVADMALVGGVILFGIVLIRDERNTRKNAPIPVNSLDNQERLDL